MIKLDKENFDEVIKEGRVLVISMLTGVVLVECLPLF